MAKIWKSRKEVTGCIRRHNRKRGDSWKGRFSEPEDMWFQVIKSHGDELDPQMKAFDCEILGKPWAPGK